MHDIGPGTVLLLWILAIFLYWVPTITAYRRKKANREAIAMLNFLLGWTIVGWVVAMVWSVTVDKPAEVRS